MRSIGHLVYCIYYLTGYERLLTPYRWEQDKMIRDRAIEKSTFYPNLNQVGLCLRGLPCSGGPEEAYLEPSQTFNMELFAKIANGYKPFLIFAKNLDILES